MKNKRLTEDEIVSGALNAIKAGTKAIDDSGLCEKRCPTPFTCCIAGKCKRTFELLDPIG